MIQQQHHQKCGKSPPSISAAGIVSQSATTLPSSNQRQGMNVIRELNQQKMTMNELLNNMHSQGGNSHDMLADKFNGFKKQMSKASQLTKSLDNGLFQTGNTLNQTTLKSLGQTTIFPSRVPSPPPFGNSEFKKNGGAPNMQQKTSPNSSVLMPAGAQPLNNVSVYPISPNKQAEGITKQHPNISHTKGLSLQSIDGLQMGIGPSEYYLLSQNSITPSNMRPQTQLNFAMQGGQIPYGSVTPGSNSNYALYKQLSSSAATTGAYLPDSSNIKKLIGNLSTPTQMNQMKSVDDEYSAAQEADLPLLTEYLDLKTGRGGGGGGKLNAKNSKTKQQPVMQFSDEQKVKLTPKILKIIQAAVQGADKQNRKVFNNSALCGGDYASLLANANSQNYGALAKQHPQVVVSQSIPKRLNRNQIVFPMDVGASSNPISIPNFQMGYGYNNQGALPSMPAVSPTSSHNMMAPLQQPPYQQLQTFNSNNLTSSILSQTPLPAHYRTASPPLQITGSFTSPVMNLTHLQAVEAQQQQQANNNNSEQIELLKAILQAVTQRNNNKQSDLETTSFSQRTTTIITHAPTIGLPVNGQSGTQRDIVHMTTQTTTDDNSTIAPLTIGNQASSNPNGLNEFVDQQSRISPGRVGSQAIQQQTSLISMSMAPPSQINMQTAMSADDNRHRNIIVASTKLQDRPSKETTPKANAAKNTQTRPSTTAQDHGRLHKSSTINLLEDMQKVQPIGSEEQQHQRAFTPDTNAANKRVAAFLPFSTPEINAERHLIDKNQSTMELVQETHLPFDTVPHNRETEEKRGRISTTKKQKDIKRKTKERKSMIVRIKAEKDSLAGGNEFLINQGKKISGKTDLTTGDKEHFSTKTLNEMNELPIKHRKSSPQNIHASGSSQRMSTIQGDAVNQQPKKSIKTNHKHHQSMVVLKALGVNRLGESIDSKKSKISIPHTNTSSTPPQHMITHHLNPPSYGTIQNIYQPSSSTPLINKVNSGQLQQIDELQNRSRKSSYHDEPASKSRKSSYQEELKTPPQYVQAMMQRKSKGSESPVNIRLLGGNNSKDVDKHYHQKRKSKSSVGQQSSEASRSMKSSDETETISHFKGISIEQSRKPSILLTGSSPMAVAKVVLQGKTSSDPFPQYIFGGTEKGIIGENNSGQLGGVESPKSRYTNKPMSMKSSMSNIRTTVTGGGPHERQSSHNLSQQREQITTMPYKVSNSPIVTNQPHSGLTRRGTMLVLKNDVQNSLASSHNAINENHGVIGARPIGGGIPQPRKSQLMRQPTSFVRQTTQAPVQKNRSAQSKMLMVSNLISKIKKKEQPPKPAETTPQTVLEEQHEEDSPFGSEDDELAQKAKEQPNAPKGKRRFIDYLLEKKQQAKADQKSGMNSSRSPKKVHHLGLLV